MTPEQRAQVDEAKARITMGWTLAQLREVYAEGAIQAAKRAIQRHEVHSATHVAETGELPTQRAKFKR